MVSRSHAHAAPGPVERVAAVLRDRLPSHEAEEAIARVEGWEELAAENARLQYELELQTETDPLTGLRNRRRFFADLRRELVLARRHEDALALVVVHLDGLAELNREHGFAAGDATLVSLAETLLRTVRVTDLVARLGDDEFAVLLPRTDMAAAANVAERLADAGEAPVRLGIAALSADVSSGQDLLARAVATLAVQRGAHLRPRPDS